MNLRLIKNFCLFLFLFTGLVSRGQVPTQATQKFCDCLPANLTQDEVDKYANIFRATVDSVEKCEDEKSIAWMKVVEGYKGKLKEIIPVRYVCSGKCAMKFLPGEEWIIYGKYYGYGRIETDACTRSRKFFADSTEDYMRELFALSYNQEASRLKELAGSAEIIHETPKSSNKDMERKLIYPEWKQRLWLYIGGLVLMVGIYFGVKKFLK